VGVTPRLDLVVGFEEPIEEVAARKAGRTRDEQNLAGGCDHRRVPYWAS
jgi:hypothetical protein